MPPKSALPETMSGTATETVAGQPLVGNRCNTFASDIPDPGFQLRVVRVEHEDSCQMHGHEYSEICIIFEGRATHLTNYGNHPLETGDVLVINRGTRHGFTNSLKLKRCNVMFDPRQFLSDRQDLHKLMGFHALFDLQPRSVYPNEFKERLHLDPSDLALAQQLVATMQDEETAREEGWQTVVEALFLQLVTLLSRCYARQRSRQVTPLTRLATVAAHIQKHFREPLRIEDLARLAHLSPSQFQRTFKRAYKTTAVKFITRLRIHESCELLKDSDHDVTRTALECGFNSPAFFSTRFKELMGEAPSAYRRRHLGMTSQSEAPHCLEARMPDTTRRMRG